MLKQLTCIIQVFNINPCYDILKMFGMLLNPPNLNQKIMVSSIIIGPIILRKWVANAYWGIECQHCY